MSNDPTIDDDLRASLRSLAERTSKAAALKLITKRGAQKLDEIDSKHYPEMLAEAEAMKPDTGEAITFLRRWYGDQRGILVAIEPDLPKGHSDKTDALNFGLGDDIAPWIKEQQGIRNTYFTVNLAKDGYRKEKKPEKADIGQCTALHVDRDPEPGKPFEEEQARIRALFTTDLPEGILPPSVIIFSGGGYQAFWLLKEPVAVENIEQLEDYNRGLEQKFGGDSCHNIDRVMRVPGTINLPNAKKRDKGRKPAVSKLIEAHWDRRYSLDDFVPVAKAEAKKGKAKANTGDAGDHIKFKWLEIKDDVLNKLFRPPEPDEDKSARAYGVVSFLIEHGRSDEEIVALILKHPESAVRMHYEDEDHIRRDIAANIRRKVEADGSILPDCAPMTIAEAMLDGKEVVRSNGDWFEYDPTRNVYVAVSDEGFRSCCWTWVDKRKFIKGDNIERIRADKHLIADVEAAACALRQGPSQPHCWFSAETNDPPPNEIMVCGNGLLHLPTRKLIPPTPRFFARNATPMAFDAEAPRPELWLKYLREVFPSEADCIDTLQEVAGYFLTQDVSQQKIFHFVTPPRGGKGTFMRILQYLLGKENYASPKAKDLAKQFGMAGLIGKTAAFVSDMRIDHHTSTAELAATLLTISGEDAVSIPRKFKLDWVGTLPTKFMLASNEVQQIKDTSGALAHRMILIVGRQSFLGKEDTKLTEKLKVEAAGILNWMLEGLDHLVDRGHFVQPKSAAQELRRMHLLASPVRAFVEEEIIEGPDFSVPKEDVWDAFTSWMLECGLSYGGGREHFFKDMETAGCHFTEGRPWQKGDARRPRRLFGIDLRSAEVDRRFEVAMMGRSSPSSPSSSLYTAQGEIE